MSNKQRKLNLWRDLTNDYTVLAQRAEHEYAERTAADLFIREVDDHLKMIRAALEFGDVAAMEAAHDEAFDTFGHIIHPELFAEPAAPTDRTLEAVYSNYARVGHSASDVVIDFMQYMPQIVEVPRPGARRMVPAVRTDVTARVAMTVPNARLLLEKLQQNLDRYDAKRRAAQQAEDDDSADNPFAGEEPGWLVEIDVDDDLAY